MTERACKGILIDPFACLVSEVDIPAGDYTRFYPILSHESMPVDIMEAVHIDAHDAIFVDEEGLLKACDRFFIFEGYPQPLAGKGLVLGATPSGDTASRPRVTVDWVADRVVFLERVPRGLAVTVEPWKSASQER